MNERKKEREKEREIKKERERKRMNERKKEREKRRKKEREEQQNIVQKITKHIKHPFVRGVVKPEVQGGLNELSFKQGITSRGNLFEFINPIKNKEIKNIQESEILLR